MQKITKIKPQSIPCFQGQATVEEATGTGIPHTLCVGSLVRMSYAIFFIEVKKTR